MNTVGTGMNGYPIKPLTLKRAAKQPRDMARVNMPAEQRQFLEAMVLGIFADMTNAGCSLQSTLTAIYLSGAENAVAAMREKNA